MHEFSTYTTPEGRTISVLNDVILVRPRKDERLTDGGIHLTHDQHPHNTGEILAFGEMRRGKSSKPFPIPDLKVGWGVLFIKYLAGQHSNIRIQEMFDGLIKIHVSDVILTFDNPEDGRLFFP